jgi:hypothetical protein
VAVLFSANFGGYDVVRPVLRPGRTFSWVLFSDALKEPKGWDLVRVKRRFVNGARENRSYKLQPHKYFDDDLIIYMDSSMSLLVEPEDLVDWWVDRCGDADLYAIRHPLNHTLVDEVRWLKGKGNVSGEVLDGMVTRYLSVGVPDDSVGIEARLMIIRRSAVPLFDVWWPEVRDFVHRDQVSFHYAKFVSGVKVATVTMPEVRSKFLIHPHVGAQPIER